MCALRSPRGEPTPPTRPENQPKAVGRINRPLSAESRPAGRRRPLEPPRLFRDFLSALLGEGASGGCKTIESNQINFICKMLLAENCHDDALRSNKRKNQAKSWPEPPKKSSREVKREKNPRFEEKHSNGGEKKKKRKATRLEFPW